ncbi:efflux RND transporter periplasmic adaptor subunit [Aestuariibacter halophilus]|uniref:Efflux RND transporter periplasmic adaptor subunit n=1 Tax=Fluctibacter halophilus TaxID=226011 RepID=A0ABS8G7H9_9ALTE|nr:efflux RND transporter periplasmic adaptor subunit [Aestuariibacter halophilus]MCC2616383.1 efflux RND transporter periplasmic adaptor subunit [Aestuariibacter halophilus]
MKSRHLFSVFIISVGLLTLSACESESQVQQAPQSAPTVDVATVIEERLTEWDSYTGRLQAPQTVELRPRVSGYIDFTNFEEGALVKQGEPLFFIDNRPFKAQVKRLEADLARAESELALAKRDHERAVTLAKTNAIATETLDARASRREQAKASVSALQAQLDIAKLNLSYTHVKAPISGRVSRAIVTQGNYVTAGDTVLTTIVSTDEVYAYFDADEASYLKYAELAKAAQHDDLRDGASTVFMGLVNNQDYPYQGNIDFIDNRVNPQTGTIRVRAVFNNQDGQLLPGLFARLRVTGSASYTGILINERAIGTDLNNKFVLVVDDSNTVQYRAVTLGEKVHGLRIIESGLNAGDTIVVNGLQRVRPGTPITANPVDMTSEQTLAALHAEQAILDAQRTDVSTTAQAQSQQPGTGG